jgi:hypothetical protein
MRAKGLSMGIASSEAEVVQLTPDEYLAFQEREVQRGMNMSKHEFVEKYLANELDDADAVVSELVALLRIGQNGVGPS